jgi:hypothetical protein
MFAFRRATAAAPYSAPARTARAHVNEEGSMRTPGLLARTAVMIALWAVIGTVAPSVAAASAPKLAPKESAGSRPATWTLQTFFTDPITVAGEGVASYPSGSLLFRGLAQVPAAVSQLGFNHVGDEDIDRSGDVYDAYEDDHPNPTTKLFTITAPNGRVSDYPHPLARGEEFNNSFVTVSPDDRWLVSGEWNTERRLLLLSNPKGRPSGSSIPLAGTIALRPSLYHVQGCDFFDAVTLICSTDDAVHAVVKLSLSAPLHRGTNTATDRRLLIPREVSKCPGTQFESEGVDYNARTNRLTLTMNEPGVCVGTTDVNVYKIAHLPSGPAIGTPLADGTPMPAGSTGRRGAHVHRPGRRHRHPRSRYDDDHTVSSLRRHCLLVLPQVALNRERSAMGAHPCRLAGVLSTRARWGTRGQPRDG